LLYAAELNGKPLTEQLTIDPESPAGFSELAIKGISTHINEIDLLIRKHLIDWSFERLTPVDRSILRIATWELLERNQTPVPAIISEAAALADKYSLSDSAKFVNAVLAAIASELRPEILPDN
jgi:N utilization substance protein B